MQFKLVSKIAQSLQNSVQKIVCKKLLLHLQNLSLYLSQFTSVIFSGSDTLFFKFSLKVFCFSCFCWPIFITAMENQFDKINLEDCFFYNSKIYHGCVFKYNLTYSNISKTIEKMSQLDLWNSNLVKTVAALTNNHDYVTSIRKKTY